MSLPSIVSDLVIVSLGADPGPLVLVCWFDQQAYPADRRAFPLTHAGRPLLAMIAQARRLRVT